MHRNFLGEVILDNEDYAHLTLLYCLKNDSWNPIYFEKTDKGIRTECPIPIIAEKGIVFFSEEKYPEMIPICVSFGDIQDRIYRFGKEVLGKSRADESFPAAKRYIHNGGSPFSICAKFYSFDELEHRNIPKSIMDDNFKEILNRKFLERISL